MKRNFFALGVMLSVFGVAILAQIKTESAEQELLKLEQDWTNANLKVDVAFLDQITEDDYTWTDNDGVVWTKAQTLAAMKSGKLALIVYDHRRYEGSHLWRCSGGDWS